MSNITINQVFDDRKRVGKNINEILKEKGHTKISFAKLIGISRPTLDNLINGKSTSLTTFGNQIDKIIKNANVSLEDIFNYRNTKVVTAYYSDNAPENHEVTPKAKEMFDILNDIVNLCELYY